MYLRNYTILHNAEKKYYVAGLQQNCQTKHIMYCNLDLLYFLCRLFNLLQLVVFHYQHSQNRIGADIIMALDDVVKTTITGPRIEEAMYRTLRWIDRCIKGIYICVCAHIYTTYLLGKNFCHRHRYPKREQRDPR